MEKLKLDDLAQLERLLLRLDDEQGLYADTLIDLTTTIEEVKEKIKETLPSNYPPSNLFSNTTETDPPYYLPE